MGRKKLSAFEVGLGSGHLCVFPSFIVVTLTSDARAAFFSVLKGREARGQRPCHWTWSPYPRGKNMLELEPPLLCLLLPLHTTTDDPARLQVGRRWRNETSDLRSRQGPVVADLEYHKKEFSWGSWARKPLGLLIGEWWNNVTSRFFWEKCLQDGLEQRVLQTLPTGQPCLLFSGCFPIELSPGEMGYLLML